MGDATIRFYFTGTPKKKPNKQRHFFCITFSLSKLYGNNPVWQNKRELMDLPRSSFGVTVIYGARETGVKEECRSCDVDELGQSCLNAL